MDQIPLPSPRAMPRVVPERYHTLNSATSLGRGRPACQDPCRRGRLRACKCVRPNRAVPPRLPALGPSPLRRSPLFLPPQPTLLSPKRNTTIHQVDAVQDAPTQHVVPAAESDSPAAAPVPQHSSRQEQEAVRAEPRSDGSHAREPCWDGGKVEDERHDRDDSRGRWRDDSRGRRRDDSRGQRHRHHHHHHHSRDYYSKRSPRSRERSPR